MNPYQTPLTEPEKPELAEPPSTPELRGRPCTVCGSADTRLAPDEPAPHSHHSILSSALLPLVRAAAMVKEERCLACGHIRRYRTARTKRAMAVLAVPALVPLLIILRSF